MDFLRKNWAGLVAIVIALAALLGYGHSQSLFGSTSCANITCISGGLRLVSDAGGDFESDVAAVFNSTLTAVTGTFSGLLTADGGILVSNTNSTTTPTSITLAVSDFKGYGTVLITPTVGNITLTFPASSTASTFLPAAGDMQQTCFENSTTTTGVTITLAGGTGFQLQVASSTATVLGSSVIGPGKIGCINFVRGKATSSTFDIHAGFVSYL